jgi:hypothetical protein
MYYWKKSAWRINITFRGWSIRYNNATILAVRFSSAMFMVLVLAIEAVIMLLEAVVVLEAVVMLEVAETVS